MKKLFNTSILIAVAFAVSACKDTPSTPNTPSETGHKIYFGGDILTMEGPSPTYIEALVEHDGRIVFVGSKKEAMAKFGASGKPVDLEGHTLLPGFLDGHGHMYNVGLVSLMANILPPPDGPGANFDSLVETTKKWMNSDDGRFTIEKFGWIMANGYDDSQLAEKDHPTAEVLDRISTDLPVIMIHQSGHLSVVNTKGLEKLGYKKESENPVGGVIRRNAQGSPNGVLEEAAFFEALFPIMQSADAALMAKSVQKGQEAYAERGYTTAQDGRTLADSSAALSQAARDNKFFIDVVSYPDIVVNKQAIESEYYRADHSYKNHYRIGGVKLTLDGSPQGKTAWLSHPYHVPPTGKEKDYQGYPVMSEEDAFGYVTTAFKNQWQILSHANGDAAIDQYLKAVKTAQKSYGYENHRTVLIHGQTMRKDQIPALVDLDIYPSLFPMHTYYWGDWHAESVLGHPRADYISPTRDVVDAGRTITSHHDAPVTFPNSMRVLDATVNRVTRSGKVLGPDQRLTPYEGLKTLTEWAAIQYFEEDSKGTLTAGKLADFVVLSENPLKIDPLTIKDIKVLQTFKEGDLVYNR